MKKLGAKMKIEIEVKKIGRQEAEKLIQSIDELTLVNEKGLVVNSWESFYDAKTFYLLNQCVDSE